MNVIKFLKKKLFKTNRFIKGGYEEKPMISASELFASRLPAEEKDRYARLIEYSFFEKVK